MPLKLVVILFAATCCLAVCFAADPKPAAQPAAKPKITIGKETTFITEPLRADGYPDYAAALNQRMSEGVTPETNAAVLLQRAFGPKDIPEELRAKFFQQLGIAELPAEGDYFVDEGDMIKRWRVNHPRAADEEDDDKLLEQFGEAQQRPWSAQEFPIVAQWLKINEKPLNLAVEASRLPKRFFPVILPGRTPLIACLLPHDQYLRGLAGALATRAMFELQSGDSAAAWKTLLATHRLARLTAGNGFSLVGVLVGYALEGVAVSADLAMLHYGKLPLAEIKKMRAEFDALPPIESPVDIINFGERIVYLDVVLSVAQEGFDGFRDMVSLVTGSESNKKDSSKPKGASGFSDAIDWDVCLRTGNKWYDRLVAAARIGNRQQRLKATDAMDADLRRIGGEVKNLRSFTIDFLTKRNPQELFSPRVANVMVALMLPAMSAVLSAHDRMLLWREMNDTGFALAEFRAEHGNYPDSLSDLVPKYLAKVPDDVYKRSPGPIGYRREGDTYLMWTVHLDGIDAGGHTSEEGVDSDDLVLRPTPAKTPK